MNIGEAPRYPCTAYLAHLARSPRSLRRAAQEGGQMRQNGSAVVSADRCSIVLAVDSQVAS